MRAAALIRSIGFVLLISLPFVGMARSPRDLQAEKRHRAPCPRFTPADWRSYPERFEAYFRDSFGFREQLIHWHSVLAIKHLRESPVRNVIIGAHGRLFYAGYNDGVDIGDFAGRRPVAPAELDAYVAHNLARRDQYAALGARYLIVIVPNKQTIYPEDVPAKYGPPAPGLLDAVVACFARRHDVELLDLRPALRAHRDDGLYYDTDSHWNRNGAFWAARAIVERARAWFPAVAPLRPEDYDVSHEPRRGGDLAGMLAMADDFGDVRWIYRRRGGARVRLVRSDALHQVYAQPDARLPRVLLLGDSFGEELAPVLADAFGRVHRYYSARAGYDAALPAAEKPDLVILELVERYLPMLATQ